MVKIIGVDTLSLEDLVKNTKTLYEIENLFTNDRMSETDLSLKELERNDLLKFEHLLSLSWKKEETKKMEGKYEDIVSDDDDSDEDEEIITIGNKTYNPGTTVTIGYKSKAIIYISDIYYIIGIKTINIIDNVPGTDNYWETIVIGNDEQSVEIVVNEFSVNIECKNFMYQEDENDVHLFEGKNGYNIDIDNDIFIVTPEILINTFKEFYFKYTQGN